MVWGMMSYHGLQDLHIVPRSRTLTADHNVGEIIGKRATSALTRRRRKAPERCQTSTEQIEVHFSPGRLLDILSLQGAGVVLAKLPRILGEGRVTGKDPRHVSNQKCVADPPGKDGANSVRGQSSQGRRNGLVQDQLEDTGQPGVRRAGCRHYATS